MIATKKKFSPQEFFGIRRLKYQPSHLATIDLNSTYNIEQALDKWINKNLKKRYFLGKSVGLTKENKLDQIVRVGFEDPKELSYFVLACPLLKYK
ncbi:MAG: hypothetical protein CMA64_05940 [Euryarchaeota archaeon]|nr:hypothetical protein [Euryarchaeota archaeon]